MQNGEAGGGSLRRETLDSMSPMGFREEGRRGVSLLSLLGESLKV